MGRASQRRAALVAANGGLAVALARAYANPPYATADDLAQETLVRAARYRHRQRESLRPWIVKIAANVFRDHVVRIQRGPAFTGDDLLLESKESPDAAPGALEPGETRTVRFRLDRRAFSFYDPGAGDWLAEPGEFELLAGSSSRDIRATASLSLK